MFLEILIFRAILSPANISVSLIFFSKKNYGVDARTNSFVEKLWKNKLAPYQETANLNQSYVILPCFVEKNESVCCESIKISILTSVGVWGAWLEITFKL